MYLRRCSGPGMFLKGYRRLILCGQGARTVSYKSKLIEGNKKENFVLKNKIFSSTFVKQKEDIKIDGNSQTKFLDLAQENIKISEVPQKEEGKDMVKRPEAQ